MTETQQSTDPQAAARKRRDWTAICTVSGSLVLALLLSGLVFLVQPRTMTINVDGPPGTRFIGNVNVDQQTTLVTGITPAELTFRGRHLAFNVVPDSGSTEGFSVTLAGEEQTAKDGVGGWYDARSLNADVMLRPLTDGEWTDLRNQYRGMQISQ